jgi:hypothetical protein
MTVFWPLESLEAIVDGEVAIVLYFFLFVFDRVFGFGFGLHFAVFLDVRRASLKAIATACFCE